MLQFCYPFLGPVDFSTISTLPSSTSYQIACRKVIISQSPCTSHFNTKQQLISRYGKNFHRANYNMHSTDVNVHVLDLHLIPTFCRVELWYLVVQVMCGQGTNYPLRLVTYVAKTAAGINEDGVLCCDRGKLLFSRLGVGR